MRIKIHECSIIIQLTNVSVPMNKIVVGNTPSPNLKKVQSKVGSMANAAHKVTEQHHNNKLWYGLEGCVVV